MSKKQQVAQSAEAMAQSASDRALNKMSEEAAKADAAGTHSNLDESAPAPVVSKFKMKRTKSVAVPLFKFVANEPRFYLIDGPAFVGKKIDDKKEAATLLPVTDLETGEQGQIIVGAVLKSLIAESYPDDSYVGKKFEMTLRKRADKSYNTYDLYEVEGEAA